MRPSSARCVGYVYEVVYEKMDGAVDLGGLEGVRV
jgi:hypothetical protein